MMASVEKSVSCRLLVGGPIVDAFLEQIGKSILSKLGRSKGLELSYCNALFVQSR